jgi:hypothetical protein
MDFLLAAFDIRCARIARLAGPSRRQRSCVDFHFAPNVTRPPIKLHLGSVSFSESYGFQANTDQMLTLVVSEVPNG